MKRFLTFMLIVCVILCALSGCNRSGGEEADLVFVNQSGATIVEVVVEFQDRSGGTRNADSSPLKRGETFGFEAGEYPATVYVYDKAVGDVAEGALARLTINEAPPQGERWYVTARDGAEGLVLALSGRMCYHGGRSTEMRCGHDRRRTAIPYQLQAGRRGAVLPAPRRPGAVREDRPVF